MSNVRVAAIIPARMGSSRLPGKPLLKVHGLPMVEHVRRRSLMSAVFSDVVVATCDDEIFDAISSFGGKVLMTSKDHIMASDRVAEAAQKIDCTHIVNVQGDEILILPEDLRKMVFAMAEKPKEKFWNATAELEEQSDVSDTSIVKCALSHSGRVMYCARDFSHLKVTKPFLPIKKILGILGFSKDGLFEFGRMERSVLETLQTIDQSRVIEHDYNLNVVSFTKGYPGINEPREVDLVNQVLDNDQRQMEVLTQILDKQQWR